MSGIGPQGLLLFKVSIFQVVDLWARLLPGYGWCWWWAAQWCSSSRGSENKKCVKGQAMADVNEDEGWCTDERMVNVSAAKLKKLENLITKEHKFDSTPLGKAVC